MGLYHSFKAFAGIVIPDIVKGVTNTKRFCENHTEVVSGEFCHKCGSRIKEVSFETPYGVHVSQITGNENLSEFSKDGLTYFYSNIGVGMISIEPNQPVRIHSRDMILMRDAFEVKHKEDIEKIRNHVEGLISVEFFILDEYS